MLLKEIREGWGDHSRAEVDWNREAESNLQKFALVDKVGRVIRPGLTQRAAEALQARPDLVKKYGRLFIKRSPH